MFRTLARFRVCAIIAMCYYCCLSGCVAVAAFDPEGFNAGEAWAGFARTVLAGVGVSAASVGCALVVGECSDCSVTTGANGVVVGGRGSYCVVVGDGLG